VTLRRNLEPLRDGRWRVRKVVRGHTYDRLFSLRKAALEYLSHLELLAAGVPVDGGPETIRELGAAYRQRLEHRSRSPETIDYYLKITASLMRELGADASPQLAPYQLEEYLERRRAGGAGDAMILKELRALQSYMRAAGITPTWRVPDLRPVRHHRRLPPDDELARLILAADPVSRRALLLGLLTALRPSEVLALTWDQVDLKAGTIRVTMPKVSWENVLPIVRTLAQELKGGGDGPLLPVRDRYELARLLERASRQAGVPVWHGAGITRHLAVTWAMDAAYTEGQVALLTGHVAGITRRHYARSAGSLGLKRKILEAVEKRFTLALRAARGKPASTGKRRSRAG